MEEHEAKGSRAAALRARMRDAVAGVRRQGAASLRGVRRQAAEATDRLKSTAAAERLGSAVESWRLIKKASDAQQRGNHAMAYRLLEPEARANPDDARLVAAFWSAALACERHRDAVPAMQRIIRTLAAGGKPERAAELWLELRSVTPEAPVDPGALVRIAPVLAEIATPEQVVAALREAVHPDNSDLTPGLAVRVADLARERDPRTALCAAHRVLASADLDATKRARLEALVAELERAEAAAARTVKPATAESEPTAAPAPPTADRATPPTAAATEAAVDAALEAPAAVVRFIDIQVTEAMPTRLRDEGLGLQLRGGRKARVAYETIKALAVAEVWGVDLHPVVVIDLVLNWGESQDATLRVVRLRSDGFDPRMVMEGPQEDEDALRGFLAELLARSHAVPLPDPDGALGVRLRPFDDLETYEREVLQVKS